MSEISWISLIIFVSMIWIASELAASLALVVLKVKKRHINAKHIDIRYPFILLNILL